MNTERRIRDWPFLATFVVIASAYVVLIALVFLADVEYASSHAVIETLSRPVIRHAIRLSLSSAGISTILAMWMAVPLGYLLSRPWTSTIRGATTALRGIRFLVEGLIDLPILLPPLVIGLSLLILFQSMPGRSVERMMTFTYAVPGLILAQVLVVTALAVRMLRVAFEQVPIRTEQVARTLGCSRGQAFWRVVLPQIRPAIFATAATAWARALGEFGPILVFAGVIPFKTEVMPTAIYLELSVGRVDAAVAISLMMILIAAVVIGLTRRMGRT